MQILRNCPTRNRIDLKNDFKNDNLNRQALNGKKKKK